MKQKRFCYGICWLGLLAVTSSARVLIVPKNGPSSWAQTAHYQGEKLVYRTEDGDEKSMAREALLQVVPEVTRGKQYSPKSVKKVLGAIDRLRRKRPELRRFLNRMYDEWDALTHADPNVGKKIAAIAATFQAGKKTPAEYQTATGMLGMLKYHDLTGTYAKKIDAVQKELKTSFVQSNLKQLRQTVTTASGSVSSYGAFRSLAEALLVAGPEEKARQEISTMLNQVTTTVCQAEIKRAAKAFAGGKTIDGYLQARTLLFALRDKLADKDPNRRSIKRILKKIANRTAAMHPSWNFTFRGFPLSHEDCRFLDRQKKVISNFTLATMQTDERALLVPEQTMTLRPKHKNALVFRVWLNRLLPKSGRIGVVAGVFDASGSFVGSAISLPRFRLNKGKGRFTWQDNLAPLAGAVPSATAEKQVYLFLFLAWLPPEAISPDPENWQPLSLACRLPIKP